VAKPPAQLDREIQEALGLPAAVVKKFRSKIATYKKAVATMEAGYTEDAFRAMVRARDAIDKAIYDATAYVPYVAGQPAHLAQPIQGDGGRAQGADRPHVAPGTREGSRGA